MNSTAGLLALSIVVGLGACNSNSVAGDRSAKAGGEVETGTVTKFEVLQGGAIDTAAYEDAGSLVDNWIWEDGRGRNVALFIEEATRLRVRVYHEVGEQQQLVFELKDSLVDCESDIFLQFLPASISVTDLDGDNLAEMTFAYEKACLSDVSPKGLYLYTVEGDKPYALRGTTAVVLAAEELAPAKIDQDGFTGAPAALRDHALELWGAVSGGR